MKMASDVLSCSIDGLLDATTTRDALQVEFLMQSGVDPCSPTTDGTSPIHKAALLEPPAGPCIVSTMLSYGANPNVRTVTGLSPLHIASMWGRVETIDVLLDNGADVTLKDYDDRSALDYAEHAEERRYDCIDALTRYRENKDDVDSGCEIAGCFYESTDNRTPQRQRPATSNHNNSTQQITNYNSNNDSNNYNNYNSYNNYLQQPPEQPPNYYYDADSYYGNNWHGSTGYYSNQCPGYIGGNQRTSYTGGNQFTGYTGGNQCTGYTGGNWNYYLGNYPGPYDWNQDPYRSDNYYCGMTNTSEQYGCKDVNNNDTANNEYLAEEKTTEKTDEKICGYDSQKKNYYWHNPLDESSRVNSCNNSLTRPPRNKNKDTCDNQNNSTNTYIHNSTTTANNISIISAIDTTRNNLATSNRNSYYRRNYTKNVTNNNVENCNNFRNSSDSRNCEFCEFGGSITCSCSKVSPSSKSKRRSKKVNLNNTIVVSDDSDSFASPRIRVPRIRKASETISDISDISTTTTSSDSDLDEFQECEVGVVESSTDESFWSVSSVPNMEHNVTIDTLIHRLDQELIIQEEMALCSKVFLGGSVDSTVVIACGLQERFRSQINHFHVLCDFSRKLLSALALLDLPVVITEDLHCFGPVVEELHSCHADVVPTTNFSGVDSHLREYLRNLPLPTTEVKKEEEKGLVADIHDVDDVDDVDGCEEKKREVTDVVLFGLEAHTCVQLTALDLLEQGYNVHVVADATFSRSHDDRMFAFYRIRQSGGVVNTFESIMHSLLTDQNHPKYIPIKNLFSDNLFAVD